MDRSKIVLDLWKEWVKGLVNNWSTFIKYCLFRDVGILKFNIHHRFQEKSISNFKIQIFQSLKIEMVDYLRIQSSWLALMCRSWNFEFRTLCNICYEFLLPSFFTEKIFFYSCNKITKTWIQISRQKWFSFLKY